MKIAITSLYLPSGSKQGVGYVVHYLANELVKRGHDVTVFSQCGPSADSLYRVNFVQARARLATFGFAWDLRKIDFSGFDVLNAHGDDWFLWGTRRPHHIHTFHGSCWQEMKHSRRWNQKLRMAALAACELSAAYLADENTAVSSNTRRTVPRIKHIIPNGVSLETFAPVPENEKSAAPSIVFVGNLHGRKRGDLLLRVFREQIRPVLPDAQFWGVSLPPDEVRDPQESGEQWFWRIPLEQLRDLYSRAHVFCLPSSYEGFGVPYIEAMASGTPVVSSPNAGACEVTRDGRDGLLCRDEELGNTLLRVLQDQNLRTQLREAGLKRAQDFSWERVCAQYLALYERKNPSEIAKATKESA
jgi:glycosyltransferase involved in cell wall biosynthesis